MNKLQIYIVLISLAALAASEEAPTQEKVQKKRSFGGLWGDGYYGGGYGHGFGHGLPYGYFGGGYGHGFGHVLPVHRVSYVHHAPLAPIVHSAPLYPIAPVYHGASFVHHTAPLVFTHRAHHGWYR